MFKKKIKKATDGERRIMQTVFALARAAGVKPEHLAREYASKTDFNLYKDEFVLNLKKIKHEKEQF